MRTLLLLAPFASALFACDAPTTGTPGPLDPSDPPIDLVTPPSAADVEVYLRRLAPVFAGRVLNEAERARIASEGVDAVEPIIDGWSVEPSFALAARTMLEIKLGVSGEQGGINYDLPGNLVEHVVENDLPWSTILTSESCYGNDGAEMPCDTGAPYAAGVLGTRGYLAARAGRFNLTRASAMMNTFACRHYPLEDELQPRIEKMALLPLFRALSMEDQMDARAAGGFGNGFECYTCHGQFSLHAQLFVKFDRTGMYVADASGLQNTEPTAQLGESYDGLMASHLDDPARAASEVSQVFGQEVTNLSDAARVISESRVFVECATQNVLAYGFTLDESVDLSARLIDEMTDRALARNPSPTFRDLVVATFADPTVIQTAVAQLRTPTP
jgi:hypothetical protein